MASMCSLSSENLHSAYALVNTDSEIAGNTLYSVYTPIINADPNK